MLSGKITSSRTLSKESSLLSQNIKRYLQFEIKVVGGSLTREASHDAEYLGLVLKFHM
jgi:hypothetical protein